MLQGKLGFTDCMITKVSSLNPVSAIVFEISTYHATIAVSKSNKHYNLVENLPYRRLNDFTLQIKNKRNLTVNIRRLFNDECIYQVND